MQVLRSEDAHSAKTGTFLSAHAQNTTSASTVHVLSSGHVHSERSARCFQVRMLRTERVRPWCKLCMLSVLSMRVRLKEALFKFVCVEKE